MTNEPHLYDRVQKWVKPKKSNVSGFPSPRLSRCLAATEADQSGLVRVQCQFERAHSFVQILQKGFCLMLVLKTDDHIIGKAHDDHIAGRFGLTPFMDPKIVRVVQVDVRKRW
jgi:hypothetical protein